MNSQIDLLVLVFVDAIDLCEKMIAINPNVFFFVDSFDLIYGTMDSSKKKSNSSSESAVFDATMYSFTFPRYQ